jgi:uncharacterized protein with HEPN domain
MYSQHNLVYILTSLECIEKALIYSKGFENEVSFYNANDQMNFNACQILLQTIGEESKKLNTDLKQEFPSIPWDNIANLRNRIAHDYRGTDPNIVFDVIQNFLQPLKESLVKMISKIDYDKLKLLTALESENYKHIDYLNQ